MMSSDSFGISGQNAPTISEKIVASTLNAIQSTAAGEQDRTGLCGGGHTLGGIGSFPRP